MFLQKSSKNLPAPSLQAKRKNQYGQNGYKKTKFRQFLSIFGMDFAIWIM